MIVMGAFIMDHVKTNRRGPRLWSQTQIMLGKLQAHHLKVVGSNSTPKTTNYLIRSTRYKAAVSNWGTFLYLGVIWALNYLLNV